MLGLYESFLLALTETGQGLFNTQHAICENWRGEKMNALTVHAHTRTTLHYYISCRKMIGPLLIIEKIKTAEWMALKIVSVVMHLNKNIKKWKFLK